MGCYVKKGFGDSGNPKVCSASSLPVYFFIPESPKIPFPQDANDYWSWVVNSGLSFDGRFSWTLQTYLQLKSSGIAVFLTDEIPDKGIVIAHRDFLSDTHFPVSKILLVAIKPDRLPHPSAQVHIVQSLCDPMLRKGDEFSQTFFIPSWPQPNLISRAVERGNKFENVCFYGRSEHLALELKRMDLGAALDLNWRIKPLSEWPDYKNTDLVIAIRYFGLKQPCNDSMSEDARMKPFAKLVNCWLAGVPAILGHEPSFLSIRENELDYIEASSMEKLFTAVSHLRKNKRLREEMVVNGRSRAAKYSTESIRDRWIKLIQEVLPAQYENWQNASFRVEFLKRRKVLCLPKIN